MSAPPQMKKKRKEIRIFLQKPQPPLFSGKKTDKIDSDRVIDFETRKILVKIAYTLNKKKSQIMSFICNPTWFLTRKKNAVK